MSINKVFLSGIVATTPEMKLDPDPEKKIGYSIFWLEFMSGKGMLFEERKELIKVEMHNFPAELQKLKEGTRILVEGSLSWAPVAIENQTLHLKELLLVCGIMTFL